MFIIIIALSVNFIGDGLRDAFDPRQRRFHIKTDGIFAAIGRIASGRKAADNAKK
jgi:peptide/nickel transport system permease protein